MDIIIPFVDGDDPEWLAVFCAAKHLYPRTERAKKVLMYPFKRRYSSHGLFKYWWRALEKNYKSLTRVHLLLMQESQYPSFLRRDDPRIVVHYHRDYIPERHRPCFNSSTIELCAIKELALTGNFILANDDMYFNAPVDDTYFESDGRPLTFIDSFESYGSDNQFRRTLCNDHRLVRNHYCLDSMPYYKWYHLFQVYNGEFCNDFLTKEWGRISSGFGAWRGPSDYNHMLLMMAQNCSGLSVHDPRFPHKGYYECPTFSPAKFVDADSHQCICLNDTDGRQLATTFQYLEHKYHDPCSFEL